MALELANRNNLAVWVRRARSEDLDTPLQALGGTGVRRWDRPIRTDRMGMETESTTFVAMISRLPICTSRIKRIAVTSASQFLFRLFAYAN
jgi:hypothetical protein